MLKLEVNFIKLGLYGVFQLSLEHRPHDQETDSAWGSSYRQCARPLCLITHPVRTWRHLVLLLWRDEEKLVLPRNVLLSSVESSSAKRRI